MDEIQAGEYSAEISKLLALKPDVIHSTFWGWIGDLRETGGGARAVPEQSGDLAQAEQSFQDLKEEMPNGVVSLPRATGGYFCTQILAATRSRKPSSKA